MVIYFKHILWTSFLVLLFIISVWDILRQETVICFFLFFLFFFWFFGGGFLVLFLFFFSFLKTLSDRCVRLIHVVMMTVLLKVCDNIWRLLRLYHGFFLMKGSLLCLSGIIVIIVIRTHENEQLRPCFLMTF